MERSRRLASDILETLQQMEAFYNKHAEQLEGSEDLKDSLDNLKKCVGFDFIHSLTNGVYIGK